MKFQEMFGRAKFVTPSDKNCISPYILGKFSVKGATTLWEYMSADQSHNHPMFGPCTKYLFTDILGIKQKKGEAGFTSVEIKPAKISRLSEFSGYITVPCGKISVSCKSENGKRRYAVTVPSGVEAQFVADGLCVKLKTGENVIEA